MIKFFRKIRQKLLSKNKVSKYLLYAIGEIVLVVIGILLALQINNWNTHNQETKGLKNHLRNIQNNIKSDIVALEEARIFRDSTIAYSRNYLRITAKDEIKFEDFKIIASSRYKPYYNKPFSSRTSGFETLKNSGYIGKLSGTKIETLINEYYYNVDNIIIREASLYNNIETLENIANSEGVGFRTYELWNIIEDNTGIFPNLQKEIKELIDHPSMKSIQLRNIGSKLIARYKHTEQLAQELISEIDTLINNHE